MNKTIAVLLAGVSFLSLTACEEACTLEARTSVLVHVSDAEGEPLDGQVQFDAGDGPQDCFQIGDELEILVSAEGYKDHVQSVTIESDVCHVITQELDIELDLEVED